MFKNMEISHLYQRPLAQLDDDLFYQITDPYVPKGIRRIWEAYQDLFTDN
jgi:hypothetical protein